MAQNPDARDYEQDDYDGPDDFNPRRDSNGDYIGVDGRPI
jgi:hypothetical protein